MGFEQWGLLGFSHLAPWLRPIRAPGATAQAMDPHTIRIRKKNRPNRTANWRHPSEAEGGSHQEPKAAPIMSRRPEMHGNPVPRGPGADSAQNILKRLCDGKANAFSKAAESGESGTRERRGGQNRAVVMNHGVEQGTGLADFQHLVQGSCTQDLPHLFGRIEQDELGIALG